MPEKGDRSNALDIGSGEVENSGRLNHPSFVAVRQFVARAVHTAINRSLTQCNDDVAALWGRSQNCWHLSSILLLTQGWHMSGMKGLHP